MKTSSRDLEALAGQRVLICEDEGITILQLSRAIAHAGLVVGGIAARAETAIEIALRDRPEVVLYDIKLPGLDGMEAIARIYEAYHPCIIAIIAQSSEADTASAFGAAASIVKPASSADFLNALPECVRRFSYAVVKDPESQAAPVKKPAPKR